MRALRVCRGAPWIWFLLCAGLLGLPLRTAAAVGGGGASGVGVFSESDLQFLGKLTAEVVEQSRVRPGRRVGSSATNTCGFTLIMPGGRGGYPAFWIRDFAMSLESGFITPEEMLEHLRLVAQCQNGPVPRRLKQGLLIPAFAIPDHINFDGTAVFYPGTYAAGEDQGNGAYGILPPVDDHYEFVHIAYCLYRATGRADFLQKRIDGWSMLERLEKAFAAPAVHSATGLVVTDNAQRAVGFGFCDAIYLTGELLFPSLLRYRAAGELEQLCRAVGEGKRARTYSKIQRSVRANVARTFADPKRDHGWLLAATGTGRQPDVWGTLYAIHLGVISGPSARQAMQAVTEAVRTGTILYQGAVRHVPTNLDASATSAWERTAGVALNTYQNGAYWHTPTGWLLSALRQRGERQLAARVFEDYIQHLRSEDFRSVMGKSAPWECIGPNSYAQNGVYMTSVTLPWSVLRVLH